MAFHCCTPEWGRYGYYGILGALGMGTIPDFPASDYITAVAVGAVSGLAATGVNQMYKQMNK